MHFWFHLLFRFPCSDLNCGQISIINITKEYIKKLHQWASEIYYCEHLILPWDSTKWGWNCFFQILENLRSIFWMIHCDFLFQLHNEIMKWTKAKQSITEQLNIFANFYSSSSFLFCYWFNSIQFNSIDWLNYSLG